MGRITVSVTYKIWWGIIHIWPVSYTVLDVSQDSIIHIKQGKRYIS